MHLKSAMRNGLILFGNYAIGIVEKICVLSYSLYKQWRIDTYLSIGETVVPSKDQVKHQFVCINDQDALAHSNVYLNKSI